MSPMLDTCLEQFDNLRRRGLLLYGDTDAELVHGAFPLQFRIVPAIRKKPQLNHQPDETPATPDPFGNPDPSFVVTQVNGYTVQLNKFCVMRPQLLLHPQTFSSQTTRLSIDDFVASREIMLKLDPIDAIAFYNCCPEAGSSQPYKHVQIMLKPARYEFIMWPDRVAADSIERLNYCPPVELSVPYLVRFGSIKDMGAQGIFEMYQHLLSILEGILGREIRAHNIVFTADWMCVIPRRQSGADGRPGANSMGMMGVIWVADDAERRSWEDLGLSKYLSELGFPSDWCPN
ncbi:uncharacterized protein PV09_01309 [Verruconis gallopava]|uniref:Uncharacterized protein n=1 Tax=Verruconis gallopava TaxID=253628 RepID=A0A0D1Z611_9PEZI|nr:uncharacterized protein PV09_01309 [Verruconis gallopava]KIW08397.1 hypothetical protein PV09_01309 [Verruconis gallopava]